LQNSSGFYKLENGALLHAPNRVSRPGKQADLQWKTALARIEPKAEVDGWIWMDSKADAMKHFGIELPCTDCLRMDCPHRITAEEEDDGIRIRISDNIR